MGRRPGSWARASFGELVPGHSCLGRVARAGALCPRHPVLDGRGDEPLACPRDVARRGSVSAEARKVAMGRRLTVAPSRAGRGAVPTKGGWPGLPGLAQPSSELELALEAGTLGHGPGVRGVGQAGATGSPPLTSRAMLPGPPHTGSQGPGRPAYFP